MRCMRFGGDDSCSCISIKMQKIFFVMVSCMDIKRRKMTPMPLQYTVLDVAAYLPKGEMLMKVERNSRKTGKARPLFV